MLAHRSAIGASLIAFSIGTAACDPEQLAPPTVLAETDGIIRDLALDDTHVYWTNAGNKDVVQRVPRQDGALVQALSTGDGSPFALVLSGTSVFYSTSGGTEGDRLWSVSQNGGATSSVASTPSAVTHLVLDGSEIFFATDDGGIYKGSAGQTPEPLVSKQGTIAGLGYDELRLYWTDTDAGTLMSVTRSGGKPSAIASGLTRPRGLAIEGKNAFVTAGTTGEGTEGEVVKIGLSGGGVTSLVSGLSIGGQGEVLVFDGDLYWFGVDGNVTSVFTVPVSGGTAVTLSEYEGSGAFGLVADRENLYWAVTDGPQSQLLEVRF